MPSMDNEPSAQARANVTAHNVGSRAELLPEEHSVEGDVPKEVAQAQAEAILAESEERTINADPDDAQGGHRQSAETADLP
jgi:hypothetical protein